MKGRVATFLFKLPQAMNEFIWQPSKKWLARLMHPKKAFITFQSLHVERCVPDAKAGVGT